MTGVLFNRLAKRAGSPEQAYVSMADTAERLGTPLVQSLDEQLAGLTLCSLGEPFDSISKFLTWKDFEGFCANIMRAKGFRVRENIILRKPRAQVDLLGTSDLISLAVDCKHWKRSAGLGSLSRLVAAQRERAKRLHESLDKLGPIAPVILTVVDPGLRFVDGGAIVPVFSFGDFLVQVLAYADLLEAV